MRLSWAVTTMPVKMKTTLKMTVDLGVLLLVNTRPLRLAAVTVTMMAVLVINTTTLTLATVTVSSIILRMRRIKTP